MAFTNDDVDPIKAMDIGILHACRSLLKNFDGIIFNESQTWQHNKWMNDPNKWTEKPNIKTAADFDWLEPWLLNKYAAASIVIGIEGEKFIIFKNLYFWSTVGYTGDIENLYEVISYWCEKKRKFRRRKRYVDGRVIIF